MRQRINLLMTFAHVFQLVRRMLAFHAAQYGFVYCDLPYAY